MKSYLYLHGVRLFNKPSDKPRNLTLVRESSVLEPTRFSCIGLIPYSLENTLGGRVCKLKQAENERKYGNIEVVVCNSFNN